jgi:hypothetical protein
VRLAFPGAAESREAERLGAEYGDKLRQQAELLIHCADCNGALLAAVKWVNGRPLAAAREQGDRLVPEKTLPRDWLYSWADRGAVLHARVGSYRHVLDLGDVHAYLPPARSARRNIKVRHSGLEGACKPLT